MKTFIFLFWFFFPFALLSQNFQWAVSCGKGEYDDFGLISCNGSGDIFLTGRYYPPGIFGNDTLGYGFLPIMLVKLNSSGEFIWTKGIKQMGSECTDYRRTFVQACKQSDDVFFFGHLCGDYYFDSIHLVCSEIQFFLSKYDNNGNCLWAKLPPPNKGSNITALTFDDQDNSYILGWVSDTVNFDGHTVEPGRILARFSTDGYCTWIKHIHGYKDVVLQEFCRLSDGGFLLAGKTTAKTVFIETDTLTSSTIYGGDLLLVKYDSNGKYLWSRLDGQTGAVLWVKTIKADNNGNYFVTGIQSSDTLIFGSHVLPNKGSNKMYLVKYDSTGNVNWAVNTQGGPLSEPSELFITGDGTPYVTGGIDAVSTGTSVSFGSLTIIVEEAAMFVASYDSNGTCIGVRYAESNGGSGDSPRFFGSSVQVEENGSFFVAGSFERNAYFDETTLTSMGNKDIFIAKCNPITGVEELKTTPQNQLLIYANPNTGKCNITIPEEFANEKELVLQIFDLQGKLIQQSKIEIIEGKIKLDIQAQAKGMYTVVLSNGKRSNSGKIVFE